MRIIKIGFAAMLCATAAAGCSNNDAGEKRAQLTQREKDSILGASQIPGAKAVNRAMISADSASARAAKLDSAQNPP
jgi:hypothetical protein